MKASRFSDAQKAFILKQGSEGMPVADNCRKAGIGQAVSIRRIPQSIPTAGSSLTT
jgi:hypothetical protein